MNTFRGRGRGRGRYRAPRGSQFSNTRQPQPHYPVDRTLDHDNNCCFGITIDLELDQNSAIFFEELKKMWNLYKKSPPVINKLHQYFNICENPYEQTLRLIYNCQEFNNAKSKSLPFFLIEELQNWSTENNNRKTQLLILQLKIDAFQIISKQNALNLTKLVVEVYEIKNDGKIFENIIHCMLQRYKYKEACHSVILLGLQDVIPYELFVLPMVFQDRLHGLDEFLTSSPKHQLELVKFLDSALGQPSVKETLINHVMELRVPEVKWEKLHAKPIKKLIARYVKLFKLPSDLTPNLNKRRNEGALQFLLNKRYIENSFGAESWREMVQEAVGDNEDLMRELVTQVCLYGDVVEALRWAHFYNVDKQYWPYNVKMLEENPDEERRLQNNLVQEDQWDLDEVQNNETAEYHKFSLGVSAIFLIDTEAMFKNFLANDVKTMELVGIDCEWKPSFGSQKNELALMQLATRSKVFILDIVKLGNKLHLWQELGRSLFNNCDILKLGFGFTSDSLMIRHSLPELNFTAKQDGFLDLMTLWKQIEKQPCVTLPFEVQSSGLRLSTLVHQCLGCPLDKSDQFSNWEKRPLRESQLVYAALDAYCLIEVYDVIKNCCEKNGLSFEDVCLNLMTNEKFPKKKPKKSFKKKGAKQNDDLPQPPSPHASSISADAIKVVCDTMLQGLGKNLRRCGIDTAILENHMDHMDCVRYAQDEQRYVLTRGTVFNQLCGCVPTGHCLKIVSDNVDEQLKEFINYYKVSVTKDDVFSVCQVCNGKNYVKVSKSTILEIDETSKKIHQDIVPDDIFESTGFTSDEDDYEPGAPVCSRNWTLDNKLNANICQTQLGAKIQTEAVPDAVLNKMDWFYICETCGKVYWDGSHFEKVVSGRLKEIVQ